MLFSSTEVEMLTSLCEEGPKVAVSDGPLGGPPGRPVAEVLPSGVLRGQQPSRAACRTSLSAEQQQRGRACSGRCTQLALSFIVLHEAFAMLARRNPEI